MTQSDKDYFARRDCLSKSAIDKLLECPALYRVWELGTDEEEDSAALRYGSMVHLLTLCPKEFESQYAVVALSLATKEGKAWKAALPAGVEVVKQDEYENALAMAYEVRNHPQAKFLFDSADYVAEEAVYWEYNGVKCKCKPDAVATAPNGCRYCLDLKTTQSANPVEIQRSIAKYHYYRQAAWYLNGLDAIGKHCEAFIFAFVEKNFPHLVTMVTLDEDALILGMKECDEAIEKLKECRAKNVYPCYTRSILTLSLPKWAFKEKEEN